MESSKSSGAGPYRSNDWNPINVDGHRIKMEGEEASSVKKSFSKDTIGALILLIVLIIIILVIGCYQLSKIYGSNNQSTKGKKNSNALNIKEIVSEYTNTIASLQESTEENKRQKQKLLVHRAKKYLKLRIKWDETTASLKRLRAKNNVSEEKLESHLSDFELFSKEETDIEKERVSLYGDEYKFKIRSGYDEWKHVSILEFANYCNALENHASSKEITKAVDETANEETTTKGNGERRKEK